MSDEGEIGLLRYNSLPTLCRHALDLPESYYVRAGVSRLHQHTELNVDAIRPGDLVFVKTDALHIFRNALAHIKAPFTLVTGVSSITPADCADLLEDERIVAWCGPNLPLWSEKILQTPIGFTEKERPHGELAVILDHVGGLPWEERTISVLVTQMSDTSDERRGLPREGVHRVTERLAYRDYMALMARSRYVLCPRGKGVDTLRVWEALAAGAVPIVRSSILDPLYAAYGCIVVADWSETASAVAADARGPERREYALKCFANRDGVFFTNYWRARILAHQERLWSRRGDARP